MSNSKYKLIPIAQTIWQVIFLYNYITIIGTFPRSYVV